MYNSWTNNSFFDSSQDHFKLEAHQCPSLKDPKRDIRVPVCPVCDQPVPVNKGQDPNHRVKYNAVNRNMNYF